MVRTGVQGWGSMAIDERYVGMVLTTLVSIVYNIRGIIYEAD